MRCGNCGSPVPETAMFCPECGADARADDETRVYADAADAGGTSTDARDAEAAPDDRTGDAAGEAGASTPTEDEFEWGHGGEADGAATDDGSDWGVEESAGDAGGTTTDESGDDEPSADGEDDGSSDDVAWASSDDDVPEFDEPTRLDRPADSRHPEPVMGTHDEVVGHRVGAFLVDRFVLAAMVFGPFVVAIVLEPVVGNDAASLVAGLGFLAAFVGLLFYTLLIEGVFGQTLGKWLFGIVVVKEDGAPCTVGASMLRSLLWFADRYFFGLVALGLVMTTERSQRFGDMVADTVVVRTA